MLDANNRHSLPSAQICCSQESLSSYASLSHALHSLARLRKALLNMTHGSPRKALYAVRGLPMMDGDSAKMSKNGDDLKQLARM